VSWGKRILIVAGFVFVVASAGSAFGWSVVTECPPTSHTTLAREAEAAARVLRLRRGVSAVQDPRAPAPVIAYAMRETPFEQS